MTSLPVWVLMTSLPVHPVEQFNAVSYRVIATILKNVDSTPMLRAKVIHKWLDVAQVGSDVIQSPMTSLPPF